MEKFCAFGIGYLDSRGTIVEESENYYIVIGEGYSKFYKLALSKDERLTKVFDTAEERNQWIKDQRYEYDPR